MNRILPRAGIALSTLLLVLPAAGQAAAQDPDPAPAPAPAAALADDLASDVVFRAMADEMGRTVERLQMDEVDRPYYVEYMVLDADFFSASASFGALEESSRQRVRLLIPDVRIGSYELDNTNLFGGRGFGFIGLRQLPLEDDYDAIRHEVWLSSDTIYKQAAEMLARKEGMLKQLTIKDRPDDLAKAEPHVYVADPVSLDIDAAAWQERVKTVSRVFRDFPEIQESGASFSAVGGTQRFINNEGFKHRFGDTLFGLSLDAYAQAEDGMEIRHSSSLWAKSPEGLADEAKLLEKARKLGDTISKMAAAEIGDEYTGPVLFQDAAAAQFFVSLFLRNVADPREPMIESAQSSKFTKKVGRKVMAEFLDVVDDPTATEHEGEGLLGTLQVDDDGMPPQRISLVEEGVLQTLLMSRIPTRTVKESNGHARFSIGSTPSGSPTNVFITSREPVADDALKARLIELCEEEGLEYGILVKSLQPGGGRIGSPGVAYKVFAEDGREEPVRGIVFSGVELRALRDVIAAGEKTKVHHMLFNGSLAISVVCPSILVEELDIKKVPPQTEKRPYLERPPLGE